MKMFLYILVSIIYMILYGFTLMTFWGWFVTPLGIPAINFWHAIGIGGLVGLFNIESYRQRKNEDSLDSGELAIIQGATCVGLIVLLLIGMVIQLGV